MKSPMTHLLLAVSICAVALSGYGFLYATLAKKSAIVASLESELRAKTETASRIASARTALTNIAGDEALVQSYFVSETGVVSFIEDLQTRARAQGSALSVLSVSAGDTNTHSTLVLTLTIRGTFDAILRTVGSIEYAPYDLSVSSFTLQQDVGGGWRADLGIRVGSVSTMQKSTP